ncbi:alpha/beta hydrolase [Haematobacter genomosp. 1]|uniref:Alpha/beta hydrolase n=2 Tax=Haematobacter genomosp. 1 TaxID=366618 RepID=A0A212AAT4_9RHOB|nr:alpha/beta hydrolase [Haematobacter genomosp. 1]
MAEMTLASAPPSFALIGFSMGGYVARQMVRLAPTRVSCLVLIATSARADSDAQGRSKGVAAAAPFAGISKTAIRRSLAQDREADAMLVQRIRQMGQRLGGEVFQRQALFRRDGDLDALPEIECPTLIVAGRQDRLRTLNETHELAAGIKHTQLEIVDAGHMIPMEAPVELANAVVPFLNSCR